jgi:hypothetical protein
MYAYRTGVNPGVWHLPNGADGWARKLHWCPEVRDAVRYATQDGQTLTRRFAVDVGGQLEVISLADLSRGASVWGRFARASGFSGRNMGDVLTNVVLQQALALPDLTGYPCFRDGHLQVPPTAYLPDGYTNGEDSSPKALRRLAEALAPYPRAALMIGLSAAAPWISALELQPFTFHIVGDSTTGKTTAVTAASALWGAGYKGVTQIWNGSKLGVPGQLRDLGVLPAFRDELSTAGLSGPDRATLFSVVMEGCKRAARTREDLPRPSATWASILFSTGNMAAVPEEHISAGHPKGLIEIHADKTSPVIPPEAKGMIQRLTNDPGTAGAWVPIARKLSVAAMREAYEGAAADLGQPDDDALGWHMWRAMSLGLAGARALGIALQLPQLEASAMVAAREIIDGSGERLAELGADHGQRLVDTVAEYMEIRPAAFGLGDEADTMRTDQMGFRVKTRDGHTLTCIYQSRHKEIARAAGVEDVTVALRQLRQDGRLITSKGQGLKYKTRAADAPVYAYRLPDPDVPTRTCGDPGQNDQNSQNSPGQGPVSCSDQGPGKSEQAPGRSEQGAFGDWPDGSVGADVNPAAGQLERPLEVQDHGHADVVTIAACEACGEAMRVITAGQRWHPMCEPETPAEPVAAEPEPTADVAPDAPETAPAATSGRPDGDTPKRPVTDLDPARELEAFTKALHKHGLDRGAGEADMAAALELFTEVTGGVRWVSFAGQTGQAALARMIARRGAMKAPTKMDDKRALKIAEGERETITRYHVRPGQGRKLTGSGDVTGYDINGQYPNSAGLVELGDGNPEWVTAPRSIAGMLGKPGYVRTARDIRAPKVPELKMIKQDGSSPAAGDWLPMPVAAFLSADLGIEITAAEVCWWPRSGRRLRAYIDSMYRQPRTALLNMEPSLARELARSALKIMVNDMLGMFRSRTWSHGEWYRPDWYDMFTSLSEMNAFRLVRKAPADQQPIVKACDSLYFAAPPPCDACAADSRTIPERGKREYPRGHQPDRCGKPKGLVIGTPLGKAKLERHARVTQGMRDAYKDGSAKSFHEAVKTAVKAEQEGAGK